MTQYEALSLVIGCIAALGTLVVWFGQRKLQREANELQRLTAELAKKQLQMLKREEATSNKARLSLTLERSGGSDYKFYIRNVGDAEARNVELKLLLVDSNDSPIIADEYAEKFPLKRLPAGSSVSLIAALHMGTPTAYDAILKWTNPDGSRIEEETFAAL